MEIEHQSPEELLFLANVQYDTERFPEAIKLMNKLIEQKQALNKDERSVYGIIIKGAIDPIRSTLRALNNALTIERQDNHPEHCDMIESIKTKALHELNSICKEALETVESKLYPNAEDVRAKVFFSKQKGDLFRYISEFPTSEEERATSLEEAEKAYNEGVQTASESLRYEDPIRLGIILNFAVFKYEHQGNVESAIELLQDVIDKVDIELKELSENSKNEAGSVINLMNTNLENWSNSQESESPTEEE